MDAINGSDVPILVIHGENDDYVDYRRVSILSKQDMITNPGAEFVTLRGKYADHTRLLFSNSANMYRERIREELERLREEHGGAL